MEKVDTGRDSLIFLEVRSTTLIIALASVCAMQFKVMMDEDFGKAWENYYKLCKLSARDFFTNVITEADLRVHSKMDA